MSFVLNLLFFVMFDINGLRVDVESELWFVDVKLFRAVEMSTLLNKTEIISNLTNNLVYILKPVLMFAAIITNGCNSILQR